MAMPVSNPLMLSTKTQQVLARAQSHHHEPAVAGDCGGGGGHMVPTSPGRQHVLRRTSAGGLRDTSEVQLHRESWVRRPHLQCWATSKYQKYVRGATVLLWLAWLVVGIQSPAASAPQWRFSVHCPDDDCDVECGLGGRHSCPLFPAASSSSSQLDPRSSSQRTEARLLCAQASSRTPCARVFPGNALGGAMLGLILLTIFTVMIPRCCGTACSDMCACLHVRCRGEASQMPGSDAIASRMSRPVGTADETLRPQLLTLTTPPDARPGEVISIRIQGTVSGRARADNELQVTLPSDVCGGQRIIVTVPEHPLAPGPGTGQRRWRRATRAGGRRGRRTMGGRASHGGPRIVDGQGVVTVQAVALNQGGGVTHVHAVGRRPHHYEYALPLAAPAAPGEHDQVPVAVALPVNSSSSALAANLAQQQAHPAHPALAVPACNL